MSKRCISLLIQQNTGAHLCTHKCTIFMPFWKEYTLRFDGYQLRGLCLDASQGGAPLKSTQEAPPSHDHVSGGNALPDDFINSKWKLWDLSQWTIHLWWVAEPIVVSQTFQAYVEKEMYWWVGWVVKTQLPKLRIPSKLESSLCSFLGPAQPLPAAAPAGGEASPDAVTFKKPLHEQQKSTCGLTAPDNEVPPPYPGLEQQQGSRSVVHSRSSRSKVAASQQHAASAAGGNSNVTPEISFKSFINAFLHFSCKMLHGDKVHPPEHLKVLLMVSSC